MAVSLDIKDKVLVTLSFWVKVQANLLGALAKLLLSVFLTGLHAYPRAVST